MKTVQQVMDERKDKEEELKDKEEELKDKEEELKDKEEELKDKEEELEELKRHRQCLEESNQNLNSTIDRFKNEIGYLLEENKKLQKIKEMIKNDDITRLIDKYSKLKGIANILWVYLFDDEVIAQDLVKKKHEDYLKDFDMR